MCQVDPNPSLAKDGYRKPYPPSYFEHIEQLAGDPFTFIGDGGPKSGEFPQKSRSERVRFKQFWPFCSAPPYKGGSLSTYSAGASLCFDRIVARAIEPERSSEPRLTVADMRTGYERAGIHTIQTARQLPLWRRGV
jgi:hypothetical protein